MTVAAAILSASPEGSLALADGVARVRRLADVAWAGGAIPSSSSPPTRTARSPTRSPAPRPSCGHPSTLPVGPWAR